MEKKYFPGLCLVMLTGGSNRVLTNPIRMVMLCFLSPWFLELSPNAERAPKMVTEFITQWQI